MTIIRPKKEQATINWLIIGLATFTAASALIGVVCYNQVVNNRHEAEWQRQALRDAEVANAELKTALYDLTDAKKMNDIAVANGLVVDKNPQYIKRQLVSVVQ